MLISIDLLLIMLTRTIVLFMSGGYLFLKWFKAPRHYVSDFPFLMGLSFTALAISKIFDIILYSLFLGEPLENQYIAHPAMPLAYARWLFMLVVLSPLLYANLRVWLPERKIIRSSLVGTYIVGFSILILRAPYFAALNVLLPFLLLPVAALTVITFLFTYSQRRLPEVHGLLVGLGWFGYIISIAIRPSLMAVGPTTWGFVSVAELIDMVVWIVIFFGFIIKPRYAPTLHTSTGKEKVPELEKNTEDGKEITTPYSIS